MKKESEKTFARRRLLIPGFVLLAFGALTAMACVGSSLAVPATSSPTNTPEVPNKLPDFTWTSWGGKTQFDFYVSPPLKLEFDKFSFDKDVGEKCMQALVVDKIPVIFNNKPISQSLNIMGLAWFKQGAWEYITDAGTSAIIPDKITIESGNLRQAVVLARQMHESVYFSCENGTKNVDDCRYGTTNLDELFSSIIYHEIAGHHCRFVKGIPLPKPIDTEDGAYRDTFEYWQRFWNFLPVGQKHKVRDVTPLVHVLNEKEFLNNGPLGGN